MRADLREKTVREGAASADGRQFMEELFLSYERMVLSEIRKLVDDSWEAEDLLQTVFVKLIEKEALLRTMDVGRRTGYIAAAARNTAISALQKRKRTMLVSLDNTPFLETKSDLVGGSVEEEFILREGLETLQGIWPALDEQTRYLLEAKYLLDKRGVEIAADLGVPAANVRMALTRARRKVNELMETARPGK